MYQQFWRFAEALVRFSPHDKSLVEEKLVYKEMPAFYTLVRSGQIASQIYFVNHGCLRFYYPLPDGQEVTGFIFVENHFAGVLESFFSQTPSKQVLESLEPCQLLAISFQDLHELYELVPTMHVLVRKVLEQRMIYAQQVVASLIMQSPEERYQQLLQNRPELLNRVPQKILATYLGITPVSLSRIRKRISGKARN
ncbi:MAG: Crp/Fnr family transcriptional regulator [Bacteroidetes bacterium]|nr:Crp/Fnr family transcriptional regulator [Bacteroidota bacterium]